MQFQPTVGRAFVCMKVCVSISVVIVALLTRFSHTTGRMTRKLTRKVLGHSLVCSLDQSHRTLIRSLAHSLTSKLMGKRFSSMNWICQFQAVLTHCGPRVCVCHCACVNACVSAPFRIYRSGRNKRFRKIENNGLWTDQRTDRWIDPLILYFL